jgi:hypothetical protein
MISPKKTRLYQILDGDRELSSPLIERSSLILIAEKPRPVLPTASATWMTGTALLAFLGLLAHEFRGYLTDPIYQAGAISIFVSVLVGTTLWARSGYQEIRNFAATLRQPLRELDDILSYLQTYQADLDRRTSRYFHCVTNTKVTSYFVLSQIILALRKRSEEVAELLDNPVRENLLIAHESLSGTLVFRDSMSQTHGTVHVIPLARLKVTIVQLIEFIDEEIANLERELVIEQQNFSTGSDLPN